MNGRRQRRAAALVLVASVVATVVTASASVAGAIEELEDVLASTTTSVVDAVSDVIDSDELDEVIGSTTSTSAPTSSTTSTSSTSTTTTSTPTTTSSVVPVTTTTAPGTVTDTAAASVETTTTTTSTTPPPVVLGAVEPLPVVESVVREVPALATPGGPRSTLEVLELLRPSGAAPHLVARVLAPFPVAGPAHYTNDWGTPRHGPPAHSHEGTDIFAPRGTPVLASGDGVVSNMTTTARLGGTSLRLTTASRSVFYYAHLDRFAVGLTNGSRVETGDVIGFVGNTGNARATPPHLHYEIHPDGGIAVPPVPILDRWLAEATAAARAIVTSPAVGIVVAVQPAYRQSLANHAPSVEIATAPSQRLEMRSIDGEPVRAVDPLPLFSLAVPLGLLSFLAHRGRKRARRRIARSP